MMNTSLKNHNKKQALGKYSFVQPRSTSLLNDTSELIGAYSQEGFPAYCG